MFLRLRDRKTVLFSDLKCQKIHYSKVFILHKYKKIPVKYFQSDCKKIILHKKICKCKSWIE